ncbi:MAG: hypothetical protein V4722_04975 [Bacteroidota bacterium]
MKKIWVSLFVVLQVKMGLSQNTGIGTTTPLFPLHVTGTGANVLTVENSTTLAAGVQTGIYLATNINGSSSFRYNGAIKTIGQSTNEARLGFFTFANSFPAGLLERMSILDDGRVGINTLVPMAKLDVNGTFNGSGNASFGASVGIRTAPSNYSLDVSGDVRFQNNLAVAGGVNVAGSVLVQNGMGIVRNTSATQIKIKRSSFVLFYNGLAAGASVKSGTLAFNTDFSSASVFVGNCTTPETDGNDWAKLLIVPFDIDLVNNTCRFRVTNTSNTSISFNATWDLLIIGY